MAPIVSGLALTTIVARRAIAGATTRTCGNAALPRMLRRNLTQRLRLAEPWHVLSK